MILSSTAKVVIPYEAYSEYQQAEPRGIRYIPEEDMISRYIHENVVYEAEDQTVLKHDELQKAEAIAMEKHEKEFVNKEFKYPLRTGHSAEDPTKVTADILTAIYDYDHKIHLYNPTAASGDGITPEEVIGWFETEILEASKLLNGSIGGGNTRFLELFDRYIIVDMNSYNRDGEDEQFAKEIADYVIHNCKKIESKYGFDVYYKE